MSLRARNRAALRAGVRTNPLCLFGENGGHREFGFKELMARGGGIRATSPEMLPSMAALGFWLMYLE